MNEAMTDDADILRELMAMTLQDRIKAIAHDLESKRHRYACIEADSLATALGVINSGRPVGNWSQTCYAKIISVEEHVENCSSVTDVVYLLKDQIEPNRLDELIEWLIPFDGLENPDLGVFTAEERTALELAIAQQNLDNNLSNGTNHLGHISVQINMQYKLEFEAKIEDDGYVCMLRTPYDKKLGKFMDLTNCITENW
jgi:hypothetical protein